MDDDEISYEDYLYDYRSLRVDLDVDNKKFNIDFIDLTKDGYVGFIIILKFLGKVFVVDNCPDDNELNRIQDHIINISMDAFANNNERIKARIKDKIKYAFDVYKQE